MAAVATVAGADPSTAIRLGIAMTALQASIGSLNDVVDAPRDAGHKPGKPIPAGLVSVAMAPASRSWPRPFSGSCLSALSGGVRRSRWPSSSSAIGYGYDLVLQGDGLVVGPLRGRHPVAAGVRLAWRGRQPAAPPSRSCCPSPSLAGTGLAIANARADLERDTAAGVDSVAVRLGTERAWAVEAVLMAAVVGAAIVTLVPQTHQSASLAIAIGAGCVVALGVAIGRQR